MSISIIIAFSKRMLSGAIEKLQFFSILIGHSIGMQSPSEKFYSSGKIEIGSSIIDANYRSGDKIIEVSSERPARISPAIDSSLFSEAWAQRLIREDRGRYDFVLKRFFFCILCHQRQSPDEMCQRMVISFIYGPDNGIGLVL